MPNPIYNRIFILNVRGIGDLVMALPLLHSLRGQLPGSHINLGVSVGQIPLARTLEGTVVDELTKQVHQNRIQDRVYFANKVRQFKPDLLVELSGGYRYFLAGYSSSARAIYSSSEDSWPGLKWIPIERLAAAESRHRVDRQLQLLSHLNLQIEKINFDFPVSDETIERADSLMRDCNLRERRLVALLPEAGQSFKVWPVETLRRTVDALVYDLGYNVVVFGKNPCRNLNDKPVLVLRGKTDLLTDAYLLRYGKIFDVVIGTDTGMMHIAGAVNSNENGSYTGITRGNLTISLFGPTDPARYRPYDLTGRFNVVVQPKLPAFSRDAFGYANDWKNRQYMREISAPMIIEKVARHLEMGRLSA